MTTAVMAPPGPRRRPHPSRQCTEIAVSSGQRCTNWTLPDDSRCHSHARRHPKMEAVTAAVAAVQLDGVAWHSYRFGSREWQNEAWRLYDITGPLRYIANWIGNSVSRCRLYVAEVDETGEAGEETDDPDIAALAAGPLGSGPAKDEALRLCGVNLYIPGEAYIVAEAEGAGTGEDQWFVVSGRQIRRSGDQIVIRRSMLFGGGDMVYRPDVDLILRSWTPHPADTDEPDSPARSAIPDLREIEALKKREFAELDSRLTGAGLLPLPQEIDFPRTPQDPTGLQGFTNRLMQAMGTSLQDRSSAEAMVPIAITMPGEFVDKIKPVTFWSELSAQLLPLREGAVRSLARSLDIPPEVLLGQSDSNHWTAWQTSEDAIAIQVVPILSRIADALTTGYLRRALEQMGEDPERFVYAFDTSPLTVRPNRSADALNYHAAGLLSDEAAVEAGAFRPDQMPDVAERVRHVIERAVIHTPQLLGDPAIQQILGVEGVVIAPIPQGGGGGGTNPAPVDQPTDIPQQPAQAEGDNAAALIAVANLAVRRALSLAGGRLVPHTQRDRYPGTPRHQLHARYGQVSVDRADRVLRGAWEDLPETAADLGLDPGSLQRLLHGFCLELLSRGIAYDPYLLRELVTTAVHKRHLTAPMGVAA